LGLELGLEFGLEFGLELGLGSGLGSGLVPPAAPLLVRFTAASRSSCEATAPRKTACACCVRACNGGEGG